MSRKPVLHKAKFGGSSAADRAEKYNGQHGKSTMEAAWQHSPKSPQVFVFQRIYKIRRNGG
ncbi:hypothetical protein CLV89_1164 [Tritonibacter scottomollicae]|uniref:Uncharacterized protein n=1 Tax=Tritonibacter scottomollicae TaxID=483013 RepID=A0A2T1A9J6_TRISK|nr:hypothetical protein CLV89_1164 [Tritonibacter scottomollicae]